MNATFLVSSLFDCSLLEDNIETIKYNSFWKQTIFGCRILNVLQEIYHFNVEYVIQKDTIDMAAELTRYNNYNNKSVDIFAIPMSLRSDVVKLFYPVHHLFDWNFGFTIYRPETLVNYHHFYAKPFCNKVWNSLFVMTLFCSIIFYFFKCSEVRLVAGVQWESSFGYEVLMIIGAYCQHIPPIDAVLFSRRGAYFAFFMFAFLIHTFYASNLLSNIVNDKNSDIDANTILESDVKSVILEDVTWIIRNNIAALHNGNMSETLKKVFDMKSVTIHQGLEALKSGRVALLSDYVTLEPFLRSVFENHEICDLTNIDVYTNIKKYFFVSHDFPYIEEFKVALLQMQETGIINRIDTRDHPSAECVPLPHFHTNIYQILSPLSVLVGTYALCVIILVAEVVHFKRYKLWPYVE